MLMDHSGFFLKKYFVLIRFSWEKKQDNDIQKNNSMQSRIKIKLINGQIKVKC